MKSVPVAITPTEEDKILEVLCSEIRPVSFDATIALGGHQCLEHFLQNPFPPEGPVEVSLGSPARTRHIAFIATIKVHWYKSYENLKLLSFI